MMRSPFSIPPLTRVMEGSVYILKYYSLTIFNTATGILKPRLVISGQLKRATMLLVSMKLRSLHASLEQVIIG